MIKTLLLTLSFSLLLLPVSVLRAQDNLVDFLDIEVLNPTGFLAPGESQQIYLAISNPAGSGKIIEGFTESFLTLSSHSVGGQQPAPVIYSSPDACPEVKACVVAGQFPLQPGESMQVAYHKINAIDGIPEGTELGHGAIWLAFNSSIGEVRAYASNRELYIVTASGEGDPAVFSGYEIDLPPLKFPDLDFEFLFPAEIEAGTHFNLRVWITNKGDQTFSPMLARIYSSPISTGQFSRMDCVSDCLLSGSWPLSPGNSLLLDLADFYYEGELLEADELTVENDPLYLWDPQGRSFTVSLQPPGPLVSVREPESGAVANPVKRLPYRLSPLSQSLLQPGDNLVVHDPNTGFNWLRVDVSAGIPYSQMLDLLENHAALEGYSIARQSQVKELILNHAHAAGVELFDFELAQFSYPFNFALHDFQQRIGTTSGSGSFTRLTEGIVADEPGLNAGLLTPYKTAWLASTSTGRLSGSFGSKELEQRENISEEVGYWLVNTHQPLPSFPQGQSYFSEEVLVVPGVDVAGQRYDLRMNFRKPLANLLQLTSISETSELSGQVNGSFSVEEGILEIHGLSIHPGDTGAERFNLQLQYLPESQPPSFELLSVTSADR